MTLCVVVIVAAAISLALIKRFCSCFDLIFNTLIIILLLLFSINFGFSFLSFFFLSIKIVRRRQRSSS